MEQFLADVAEYAGRIAESLADTPRRAHLFRACFTDTATTAAPPLADGSVVVLSSDVPAMWLRDSAALMRPYLPLAGQSAAVCDVIAGVVRRQFACIGIDPYANAFNASPSGAHRHRDFADQSPWVWERKYGIDSLCHPICLAADLWRGTGRTDHLDGFGDVARTVIALWRAEQDHRSSPYAFDRPGARDTLPDGGRGAAVGPTGMTWSGFRPSDEPCRYGYLVPSNAFAVVALADIADVAVRVLGDDGLAREAQALGEQLVAGIAHHGTVPIPGAGLVYAYESDGLGHHRTMDDASIPSLLSLPYLGFCPPDDPTYLATRALVLSDANPYHYRGARAQGIGSPQTPAGHVWHLSLAMQGLTTTDPQERLAMLVMMEDTDGGAGLLHEGFDADDPSRFTRPRFPRANALYCELVLSSLGIATAAPRP